MRAPVTPVDEQGNLLEPIKEAIQVLRSHRNGNVPALSYDPGPNPTLADLYRLALEWQPARGKERADLAALGQHLEPEVWPLFEAMGMVQTVHATSPARFTVATWGGAAACYDKFGLVAENAGNGVDLGDVFVSLAWDRKLGRDAGQIDDDTKLLNPQTRYGGLRFRSSDDPAIARHLAKKRYTKIGTLETERDLINWMHKHLALPDELRRMCFWQVPQGAVPPPSQERASALAAADLWVAGRHLTGRGYVLGKGPHRLFQSLDMADAFGPDMEISWIGPGIEPGWVSNSVAQLYNGLGKFGRSYVEFEERQGRNPLGIR